MEDDEEELYLYSWLDPKNDGKLYTEDEVRDELGPNGAADTIVQRLKDEGVIASSYDVNKQRGILNVDNLNEKVESLETELRVRPFYYATDRYAELNSYDQEHATDPIDVELDNYYNDILDNQYDKKSIDLLNSMISTIEELEAIGDYGVNELQGKWAVVNKDVIDYNVESIKQVKKYMIDSMVPAIDLITKLTECLEKRFNKKVELGQKENSLAIYKNAQPTSYEYVKNQSKWLYGADLQMHYIGEYSKLRNQAYDDWEEECTRRETEIIEIKQEIENLTTEAKEYLDQVELYSMQTIEFKSFVSSL